MTFDAHVRARSRCAASFFGLLVAIAYGHVTVATALADAPTGGSEAPAAAATAPSGTAPEVRTAPPYAVAIAEGYAKLREGDATAAQLAFQRAVAADGAKSEGHYLLGITMRRNGSIEPALDELRTAHERATAAADALGEGRALLAIAETLAAQPHHQAEARAAWNDVVTFAERHPDVLAPTIPRAHLDALARVAELETQMEPVRHRIAAREREHRGHHGAAGH